MLRLYFDVHHPDNHTHFSHVWYDTNTRLCVGVHSSAQTIEYINDLRYGWFDLSNYEDLYFIEIPSKEDLVSSYPELFI